MKLLKRISFVLPRIVLISIFAVYVVFALLSYFDYIERYLFPLHFIQGKVRSISDTILIGPYPHFDELQRLKKETGINVVISLLNTALPQEKALLRREKKIAERIGVTVYSYPMSYIDFGGTHNKKAGEDVASLVRELGDRKIYIHCYLGRHRVVYIRDVLMKNGLIKGDYLADNKINE